MSWTHSIRVRNPCTWRCSTAFTILNGRSCPRPAPLCLTLSIAAWAFKWVVGSTGIRLSLATSKNRQLLPSLRQMESQIPQDTPGCTRVSVVFHCHHIDGMATHPLPICRMVGQSTSTSVLALSFVSIIIHQGLRMPLHILVQLGLNVPHLILPTERQLFATQNRNVFLVDHCFRLLRTSTLVVEPVEDDSPAWFSTGTHQVLEGARRRIWDPPRTGYRNGKQQSSLGQLLGKA
jgi:hypothetical protein